MWSEQWAPPTPQAHGEVGLGSRVKEAPGSQTEYIRVPQKGIIFVDSHPHSNRVLHVDLGVPSELGCFQRAQMLGAQAGHTQGFIGFIGFTGFIGFIGVF